MAMKLYSDQSVQDIADAIRTQNGTTNTYTIGEMAQAILDISGGGISTLTNIGWNGTYYSNSTGSSGSSAIFYYNSVSSQYMTVSGQGTGTIAKDCKLLVVINTVHSTFGNLNTNDWLNIKVNGVNVLETPHGTQRVATNAILLDLKQGDIITGVVHHTSTGYQVNFIYDWYEAS